MNPERWEEINRLYHAVLEVEVEERATFLERACRRDAELRREVDSLLAYDQQAQQLMDRSALRLTAEKLAAEPVSLLGRKLGPYQIQAVLGVGGMGEVYKAKDTRLNRTVAIKVLPRHLSEREDLRQRFEREARAIASLNHPNICAVYDIGKQNGIDFLVMEYLEGETLSKRLKKGPLPTEHLLRIAIEIATALDQAHRHGVTHRDLKPGNIMLTKTGAKLLDFGLAKQQGGAGAPRTLIDARGSARPTQSDSLTEEGMILGTLEYMAPEQVEGKEMDARTDIFAFGVVMYEMATGWNPFEGESKASLTAAILASDPLPISRIQPMTPPALDHVVQRCLAKDPEDRWQSAGDIASELKWIAEAGGAISAIAAGAEAAGLKPIARGRRRELLYGALAVAFLVVAIFSVVSYLRLARAPARALISEILPPEKNQFNIEGGPPALSPDGRALAFSAEDESGKTMLWLRSLDSLTTRPLAGTENGTFPFWSGDGQKLGFFTTIEGKLKTIPISGGPTTVLANMLGWGGGTWNRDGTILYVLEATKGLYQIAASGGPPTPVLEVDRSKCQFYRWPKFLPDGKHFLYQAWFYEPSLSGIYLASLDGKENQHLLTEEIGSTYASGYLLYIRDRILMAQAFDRERKQLKGDAHPVAEWVFPSDFWGCGLFDVSQNGLLIYYRVGSSSPEKSKMSWFDRAGKQLRASEEGDNIVMRFSPDGTRLAFNLIPSIGIWVEELGRGARMRLTAGDSGIAVWAPDGSRILFSRNGGDRRRGIYQKNSDGTGGEEMLLPAETTDPFIMPTSWSRDGRFILYTRGSGLSYKQDLWILPLTGDLKPRLFVQSAFDGQFSPDGRWVAYTSPESGSEEVYVVPFEATKALSATPGTAISLGGKWQISHSGGAIARWRGDGKEIFYRSPGTTGATLGPLKFMWAAEVDGRGKSFKARKAQPLFKVAEWINSQFDVTPDGKQFVIITQKTITPNSPLTLVENWTALLGNKP